MHAFFSPTDVHDNSEPSAMLKVLRVLLLLRVECPGEAIIDDSLLKALEASSKAVEEATAAEAELEPQPPEDSEPQPPTEESKPQYTIPEQAETRNYSIPVDEPIPPDDEDPELLAAEKAAQEAAEAAQALLAAAKEKQEKAVEAAKERAAERTRLAEAEKARIAEEKASADRLAAEKLAADKLAAAEKDKAAQAAAQAAAVQAQAKPVVRAASTTQVASAAAPVQGRSSASAAYLAGKIEPSIQNEVLRELVNTIHAELSVEFKQKLHLELGEHLDAVHEKVMAASDKELRVLCHEMGLGASLSAVPENKERKWYVNWILQHGRVGS